MKAGQDQNANLNRRLGRRSSVDTISATVSKIASHLWNNHSRTVPLDDLAQVVDAQPLSQLDWEGSITKALEDEGLLLYRDMRDGDEVVAFTYDLVAGYSIAKHLFEVNQADLETFLGSSQTCSLLFEDESDTTAYVFKEGLHPLYDDIRRCTAALLPTYSDTYLHELIEQGVGFGIGIEALFEMRPTLVNARCIATVEKLFAEPRNRPRLLKLATATLAHVDHPLSISFWSQLLCGLSMPERDRAWSEYVRGNDRHFFRLVESFEERLQSPKTPTPLAESRLHLLAQIAMWLLTSTVRPLRDVATRSLYYYGRRYLTEFFGLMKSSFEIGDPYVRERMVAATYGVAMAYRHELSKGSNEPKALIGAAQTLFELMFAQGAPYATTHVLTHDYAKRTINLILEFLPTLLNDGEKARLEQPYPGKSSTWQELAPADGSYFGEGDSPMHMDFANYTLGGLVPDRNNCDFNHPEYQKVHRQILWRIHDLGHSSDRFAKIDKGLANYSWAVYQRKSDGRKIDRYGKKYSWIAYHELYGLRQDKGLLKERLFTPPERPYSADIDPSFPMPVEQHQLVKENFLGDLNEPLYDWIREGGLPDINPYLVVTDLKGKPGPWVLLNGYVNQVNKDAQRGRFTFIRGLIVKDSERDVIRERLEQQNLGGRWLPEIFEEHLTFAGEVPWADTFHANNVQELRFLVGGRRRDAEVPETAATESDEKNPLMLSVGSTTDEPECYKVLIPVQTVGWSESTSAANLGLSADVPSKELATELNLQSRPQTFDLFDTEGERASLMTEFKEGEEFNSDAEFFTFLRQDLLNTYLLETAQSLIWAVWGEREQEYESLPGMTHLPGKTYQVFQEIKVYKP